MANTPTLQTVATSPTLIQVGPAQLWVNVTKPADQAILLVSGNVSGPQDQRVYGPVLVTASGTYVGSTIGASNFKYSTTFVDIKIETATATVEKVLDQETAMASCSIAEMTAENLQQNLPGSYWNQPVATISVSNDPLMAGQVRHIITVGGLRLVAPMCIALVSPNRRIGLVGVGPFSYVLCGYAAVSTNGFDTPFSRAGVSVWKVDYELLGDTSRTMGDQLFQFVARQSS